VVKKRVTKVETVKVKTEVSLRLRNIHNARLIIPSHRTPSRKNYIFEQGEVKSITNLEDANFMLSIKREQTACCGTPPSVIKYFEEV